MKVSLRWLQEYLTVNCLPEELFERLTMGGTEVEGWQRVGVEDPNVVVAEVLSFVPHPNADRLRLCQVSIGSETRQIVCGAKNFEVGSRVPLALPGAELPGGLKIKESKLRGETSQGMLCSGKELGLGDATDGLLILDAGAVVGQKFSEAVPSDIFFDLEITPNRPDLLSYQGLARELAALGCGSLKPQPATVPLWPDTAAGWRVRIDDAEGCPFYSAVVLADVQVTASPAWLQEKIRATGHRPINNVVDITNLVLWETGQPLHAFDAEQLHGDQLVIRSAAPGEKILALDDLTHELQPGDVVIADGAGPQAMAGIMGGRSTGVSGQTRRLVLESAWFVPARVRASSRRLGLSSDSSYRFERRVDPQGLRAARDRAVTLLVELAGAKVVGAPIEVGALPPSRGPITLRPERVARVLGVSYPETEVHSTLTSLGLIEAGEQWQPPSFRYDLEAEIDLIEELARVRGLQNIPGRLHVGWSPRTLTDSIYDRSLEVRHYLAHRGWQECLTEVLLEGALVSQESALEIRNPITAQYTHLRPSLQASLLLALSGNLAQGNSGPRLFELGRCYRAASDQIEETERLGLIVAGLVDGLHWAEEARAIDLYDLPEIEQELGLPISTRVAFGPVAPSILKAHGIKGRAYYAEYDLQDWLRNRPGAPTYRPLPSFPAIRRDLALVVERTTSHAEIIGAIQKHRPAQLEAASLFDVFEDDSGEKLPVSKKSLAYALTYRALDRTLTDKEVNAWHDQLLAKLKSDLACEMRST